ncbi:MAG TPA: FAD-dependent oxidoreductase [Pirellula sp.]|nr:FAD-dependent oxidoreductase [Pirellula sp.]
MVANPANKIVIVGGGIIGLSTAYAALRQGLQVTIVDRISSSGDNCSLGNAGMVVPSHFIPLAAPGVFGNAIKWIGDPESPFHVKPRLSWELMKWGYRFFLAANEVRVKQAAPLLRDLSFASRDLYIQWSDSGIDCSLAKKGLLILCKTEQAMADESKIAHRARDLGIPAQTLTCSETSALDPNVTLKIAGSVYYPKDCHLDPSQLLTSLKAKINLLGGKIQNDCLVTGWKTKDQSIFAVKTMQGEIEGDEFVLCGGVWSEGLVKELKLQLPMQPGKGYSLTLPNPIELPNVCSILSEAMVAVTPIGSRLRFGGTMQIGELNQSIDPRRVVGILKRIPEYMPRFRIQHFDDIQPWCGLRPVSPDGLPYIGRTKVWKNLTIATGHAMMGISLGPITGELVTSVLFGRPTRINIDQLLPDRYRA